MKLPLMNRTRQMGMTGLHASSIGWVLVGCIALGFAAGTGLDKLLGTSHWVGVGVLVGVAAGFREMFRTLTQVQKHQDAAKSTSHGRAAASKSASAVAKEANAEEADNRVRPRLFEVPAPPVPSYLKQPGDEKTAPVVEAEKFEDDEDVEARIEKLLSEHPKDAGDEVDRKKPDKM
jgi:F0F1-type ATP synthase assembly protein I